MKAIIFVVVLVAVWLSLEASYLVWAKKGFNEGFDAGKAEAKTPAFIVETCSAWWFGSNKEATKVLKTYCEMKK